MLVSRTWQRRQRPLRQGGGGMRAVLSGQVQAAAGFNNRQAQPHRPLNRSAAPGSEPSARVARVRAHLTELTAGRRMTTRRAGKSGSTLPPEPATLIVLPSHCAAARRIIWRCACSWLPDDQAPMRQIVHPGH